MKKSEFTALSIVIILSVSVVISPLSMKAVISGSKAPMPTNDRNATGTITQRNETQVSMLLTKLLASNLEDHLQEAGSVMQMTSRLPQVNNTSFSYLLNQTLPTLYGIPRDADIQKRHVAQVILSDYKDLQVIVFIMPNGNVYFEEPYSRQQVLTTNNLAFRDYFQGAVKTHSTFLGNVITSASSGQRQALIAVPIYSRGNNPTLIGVWAGGIDFQILNKDLQELNLSAGERVVYVDHTGSKIADSDLNKSNTAESFANLEGFKNAIKGRSGSNLEDIVSDTTLKKMLVTYYPIKIFQNTWTVLLIQPLIG
jgi:hypothetical protein